MFEDLAQKDTYVESLMGTFLKDAKAIHGHVMLEPNLYTFCSTKAQLNFSTSTRLAISAILKHLDGSQKPVQNGKLPGLSTRIKDAGIGICHLQRHFSILRRHFSKHVRPETAR